MDLSSLMKTWNWTELRLSFDDALLRIYPSVFECASPDVTECIGWFIWMEYSFWGLSLVSEYLYSLHQWKQGRLGTWVCAYMWNGVFFKHLLKKMAVGLCEIGEISCVNLTLTWYVIELCSYQRVVWVAWVVLVVWAAFSFFDVYCSE